MYLCSGYGYHIEICYNNINGKCPICEMVKKHKDQILYYEDYIKKLKTQIEDLTEEILKLNHKL